MCSYNVYKRRRYNGKTATLNLRINLTLKKEAEAVLSKLGIPMSVAVDMFLNQVVLSGGIPFPVTLPKAPASIDSSQMSEEDIHAKVLSGCDAYKSGRVQNAEDAFYKFEENK